MCCLRMSHVVLQVGQCGNQFGSQFFNTVADVANQKTQSVEGLNFVDDIKQRFFSVSEKDSQLLARAILVDTEAKVIKETFSSARRHGFWSYRPDSCYSRREGAANNWAMGYLKHGALARQDVLNMIRREVERCDYLSGFLCFMSVAGGTGSGLGSYLTEALKDEFSSTTVMNLVVWPFSKGDVTVQAYNAMLSFAHLQSSSDAITMFENDQLLKICTQRMGLRDVSLDHLNTVAGNQLAALLLPCNNPFGVPPVFGDILAHLTPHPQYKLIGLRSVPQESRAAVPFSVYTWQGLLRTLRRMVLYSSIVDEISAKPVDLTGSSHRDSPVTSLSNLLILRGPSSDSADSSVFHKPSLPYVSWVPPALRLQTWTHPYSLYGHDKVATLASNGQFLIRCIDEAVAKAWKMFNYKAYIHHYKRYGLSEDDFIDCFARTEQVIASYKSLSSMS